MAEEREFQAYRRAGYIWSAIVNPNRDTTKHPALYGPDEINPYAFMAAEAEGPRENQAPEIGAILKREVAERRGRKAK